MDKEQELKRPTLGELANFIVAINKSVMNGIIPMEIARDLIKAASKRCFGKQKGNND